MNAYRLLKLPGDASTEPTHCLPLCVWESKDLQLSLIGVCDISHHIDNS